MFPYLEYPIHYYSHMLVVRLTLKIHYPLRVICLICLQLNSVFQASIALRRKPIKSQVRGVIKLVPKLPFTKFTPREWGTIQTNPSRLIRSTFMKGLFLN